MALASSILPPARRGWGEAMRAELYYAKSGAAALSWAFGCVLASMKERVQTMLSSNGRISRWVLIVEWFVCFVPLTIMWGVAVSYVVRHHHVPTEVLGVAAIGTLGPVALATSILATLSGFQRNMRTLVQALAVGFAVNVVLQLADAVAAGGLHLQWYAFDGSVFVLLALLPLAGSLHLVQILRSSESSVHAA